MAALAVVAPTPLMAQAGPQSLPLGDLLGVLKTVDVGVGNRTAHMIFDTGGGITVITPEFAERIGCRGWGQLTGFRLSGERLTMPRCGPVTINFGGRSIHQEVGIFDLAALLPPDAPKLDGVFSLDVLQSLPFTVDLAGGRLVLETPASLAARTSNAVELPVRLHRQAGGASLTAMVAVAARAGPLWMQLDAGSDAALQLPPSSVAALDHKVGVEPPTANLLLEGPTGKTISADSSYRERDMITDGNIGIPIMRQWILTFDLSQPKLWIAPVTAIKAPQDEK